MPEARPPRPVHAASLGGARPTLELDGHERGRRHREDQGELRRAHGLEVEDPRDSGDVRHGDLHDRGADEDAGPPPFEASPG